MIKSLLRTIQSETGGRAEVSVDDIEINLTGMSPDNLKCTALCDARCFLKCVLVCVLVLVK